MGESGCATQRDGAELEHYDFKLINLTICEKNGNDH